MGINAVVVSDLHIGFREQHQPDRFCRFLATYAPKFKHIIIAGDFFEFWRRDMLGCLIENWKVIQALEEAAKVTNIIAIAGNHDTHFLNMGPKEAYPLPFQWRENFLLTEGNMEFYFTHGNQWDAPCENEILNDNMCFTNDYIGAENTRAWEEFLKLASGQHTGLDDLKAKFDAWMSENEFFRQQQIPQSIVIPPKYREILERFKHPGTDYDPNQTEEIKAKALEWRTKQGKPNMVIVYGHTHVPYVDKENLICNTGTWIRGRSDIIVVKDGKVSLETFE